VLKPLAEGMRSAKTARRLEPSVARFRVEAEVPANAAASQGQWRRAWHLPALALLALDVIGERREATCVPGI